MSRSFSLRNLRQRDIALIVIVLTIVATVLWWFYMYSPSQNRITELQNDISQLDIQIQRGEAARRNLPELRLAVAQLEQDRLEFLARLPNENEVAELLDELRVAASDADVTFESVARTSGGREDEIQGVRPLGFTVSTSGNFVNTMNFMQTMETLQRFTKISQVGLSIEDQESRDPVLGATYAFTVYVFTGDDPGAQ